MKRSLSAAMSVLLAAASASAQGFASSTVKIGTAAAVRGSVKAVSTGSPVGHVLSSGKPLFLDDHVTTDAAGRLQVLLVDETVFTLGPNSDMVLDDFVYDPKTSAGKITASIAKGTFRFVTGKIARRDPSNLKIKAAVGTIGVRGSIGVGETGPGGTTIINGGARNADNYDDAAGIYAQSGGKTVNLSQPGVGTRISPDGRVGDARFMTGELNRIMGTLQAQTARNDVRGARPELGRKPASDSSGRSTAVGNILAAAGVETLALAKLDDAVLTQAVQSSLRLPDGIAAWSQVQGLGGTGEYIGSGLDSGSNTITVDLVVNFGARTLGGGASLINTTQGTGNVGVISYAGLSGPAKIDLSPVLTGSATFLQADLSLFNKGGIAAKTAVLDATFKSGAGATFTATVTSTR